MSRRELEIVCDGGAGAIELLDHRYRVVQEGVGSLRASLAPGLYKVRVAAGGCES